MKKAKILALALCVLMLGTVVLSSCAKEKAAVHCTVSVVVEGETLFGPYEVTSEYPVDESAPTILKVAQDAFTANEVPSAATDDGRRLSSVTLDGTEYTAGNGEEGIYSWITTINGSEPSQGMAGDITANEGDVIVFTLNIQPYDDQTPTPDDYAEDETGN